MTTPHLRIFVQMEQFAQLRPRPVPARLEQAEQAEQSGPRSATSAKARSITHGSYRFRMRLKLAGSMELLSKRVPVWCGALEAAGADACTLSAGADSIEMLAAMILMTPADFEILDSHELIPELRRVAERLIKATT
ncbi:MAG: hypothetical protein ABI885_07715 [Gammaproteobacteria bacterium]